METQVNELDSPSFPPQLREIPDIPKKLYYRGQLPSENLKLLAVVGSRNYTNYGKQAVETLVKGLRGYPIGIISGLALGIDGLAHRAALDSDLYTLAVPGSGLSNEVLYPRRHKPLALEILERGGGLLSEYEPDFRATVWSFPQRNRIMAGLAHAVLVIEASERSGTLITSRLATDYNRDVFAVPGSIFGESSKGPHMLIKLGATPVTSAEDIIEALRVEPAPREAELPAGQVPESALTLLTLLSEPRDRDFLIRTLQADAAEISMLLMQLEIEGQIRESGGMYYRLH